METNSISQSLQRHRTVDNLRHPWDGADSSLKKWNSQVFTWDDEFWDHSSRRGSNSLASSASTFEEVESLCLSKSSSDSMGSSQRQWDKFNSGGTWNGPSSSRRLISRQSSTTSTSTSRSSGLLGDAGRAEASDVNVENRQSITDTLLESMEFLGSHGNLDFADRFYLETIFQRVLDWNNGLPSSSVNDALNLDRHNGAAKTSQRSPNKQDGFRNVDSLRSHAALRDKLEKLKQIDKSQPDAQLRSETSTKQISQNEKKRRRDLILPEEDDVGTQSRRYTQLSKPRAKKEGINREISYSSRDTSTSSKGLSENSVNSANRRSYVSSMSSVSMDNGSLRGSPKENTVRQPTKSTNVATLLPHLSNCPAGSFESTASPSDPYIFSQPYTTSHAERVLMGLGFGAAEGFLPERFLKDWYTKISKAQMESKMASLSELKSQTSCDNPPTSSHHSMAREVSHEKERVNYNGGPSPQIFPGSYPSPRLHGANNLLPTSNYHDSKLERLKEYISAYSDNISLDDDRDMKIKQFAMSRQKSLPLCLETLTKVTEGGTKLLGIDPFDKEARLQVFISDALSNSETDSNSDISHKSRMHSESDNANNSSEKQRNNNRQHRRQQSLNNYNSEQDPIRRMKESKQDGDISYDLRSKHKEINTKYQLPNPQTVSDTYKAVSESSSSRPQNKAIDRNHFVTRGLKSPARQAAVDSGDGIYRVETNNTTNHFKVNTSLLEEKTEIKHEKDQNSSSNISQRQLHNRDSTISKDSIEVADIMQNQANKDRNLSAVNQRPGNAGKGPTLKSALKHVEPAMVSIVLEDIDENEGRCNADLLSVTQEGIHLVIPLSALSPIPQSPITVIEVALDNQQDSLDTEGTCSSKDTDDESNLTTFDSDEYGPSKHRNGRRSSLCNLSPRPDRPQRRRSTGLISPIPCQLSLTQLPNVTKGGHCRRRLSLEVPVLPEIRQMLEKQKLLHTNQSKDSSGEPEKCRKKRRASFSEAEPIIINDVLARERNISPVLGKQFSSPHDSFEQLENYTGSNDIPEIQLSPPTNTNENINSRDNQYIESNSCNKETDKRQSDYTSGLCSHGYDNSKDTHNTASTITTTSYDNLPNINLDSTTEFKIAGTRSIESSPGSTKSAFRFAGKRTTENSPLLFNGYCSETDAEEFPTKVNMNLIPRPISSIGKNLQGEDTDAESEIQSPDTEIVSGSLKGVSSSSVLQFSDQHQMFSLPGQNIYSKVKAQMISRAVEVNDSTFPYIFLNSHESITQNISPDYYYASDRSVQCDLIGNWHESAAQHVEEELFNKYTQTDICKYEISSQTSDTFYFINDDCQISNQTEQTQNKAVNTIVCLIGREHGNEYTQRTPSNNVPTDYNDIDETIQEIDDELNYIDNKRYQRSSRNRVFQYNLKQADLVRTRMMTLDGTLSERKSNERDYSNNETINTRKEGPAENENGVIKRFAPSTWQDATEWANTLETYRFGNDVTCRRTVDNKTQELCENKDVTVITTSSGSFLHPSVHGSVSVLHDKEKSYLENKEMFTQYQRRDYHLSELSKHAPTIKEGQHGFIKLEHAQNNSNISTTNLTYNPNKFHSNVIALKQTESQHFRNNNKHIFTNEDNLCICPPETVIQNRKYFQKYSIKDYNKSLAKSFYSRHRKIPYSQPHRITNPLKQAHNEVTSRISEPLIVEGNKSKTEFVMHPTSLESTGDAHFKLSLAGNEHTDRSHSKVSRLKYTQSFQSSSSSLDIVIDFENAGYPLGISNALQADVEGITFSGRGNNSQSDNNEVTYCEGVNPSQSGSSEKTHSGVNLPQPITQAIPYSGINPPQPDFHGIMCSGEETRNIVEANQHINPVGAQKPTDNLINLSQNTTDISSNIDPPSIIVPLLISDEQKQNKQSFAGSREFERPVAVCGNTTETIPVIGILNSVPYDSEEIIKTEAFTSGISKAEFGLNKSCLSNICGAAFVGNKPCLSSNSEEDVELYKPYSPNNSEAEFVRNKPCLPSISEPAVAENKSYLPIMSKIKIETIDRRITPEIVISPIKLFQADLLQVPGSPDHLFRKAKYNLMSGSRSSSSSNSPLTSPTTPIIKTIASASENNSDPPACTDNITKPYSFNFGMDEFPPHLDVDKSVETKQEGSNSEFVVESEVNGSTICTLTQFIHQRSIDKFSDVPLFSRHSNGAQIEDGLDDTGHQRESGLDNAVVLDYLEEDIVDTINPHAPIFDPHVLAFKSNLQRCQSLANWSDSIDVFESVDVDSNKSEAGSNENEDIDDMEVLVEESRKLRMDSDSSYSEAILDISDSISEDSFCNGSITSNSAQMCLLTSGNDVDDLLQVSDFGGLSPTPGQIRVESIEASSFSPGNFIHRQLSDDETVSRPNIRLRLRDLPLEFNKCDIDSDDELDSESELKLREQLRQNRRESRHSLKDNLYIGQNVLFEEINSSGPDIKNKKDENDTTVDFVAECKINMLDPNTSRIEESSQDECDREISRINLNGPIIRKLTKMSSDPVDKDLYCRSISMNAMKESAANLNQNNPLWEETLVDVHTQCESDNLHVKVDEISSISESTRTNFLHSNAVKIFIDAPLEKLETHLEATLSDSNKSEIQGKFEQVSVNVGSNISNDNFQEQLDVARVLDVEYINEESEKELLVAGERSVGNSSIDIMDELEMIALFNKIDDYDRTMNLFVDYSSESSSEEFKLSQISEEETQNEDTMSEGSGNHIWHVRNRFVVVPQDTQETTVDIIDGSKLSKKSDNDNNGESNNRDTSSLPLTSSEIIFQEPCDNAFIKINDFYIKTDTNGKENKSPQCIQADYNEMAPKNNSSNDDFEDIAPNGKTESCFNQSLQKMNNKTSICNIKDDLSSNKLTPRDSYSHRLKHYLSEIKPSIKRGGEDNVCSTEHTPSRYETEVLETKLDLAGNIITTVRSSRTLRIKCFSSCRSNLEEATINAESLFGSIQEPKHISAADVVVSDYRSKNEETHMDLLSSAAHDSEGDTPNTMFPDGKIMRNNNITHTVITEEDREEAAKVNQRNSFISFNNQHIACGQNKKLNFNLHDPKLQICTLVTQEGYIENEHTQSPQICTLVTQEGYIENEHTQSPQICTLVTQEDYIENEHTQSPQICTLATQEGYLEHEHTQSPVDYCEVTPNVARNKVGGSLAKIKLHKMLRSVFIEEDLETPIDMTNLCDANNHSTESGINEDLKKTVRSLFLINEDLDTPRDMTNLCDANNHSTESGIKEDLKKTVRSLFLIDEDLDTPRDMTNLCDANNHSTESGIKEDLKKTVRSLFLIDEDLDTPRDMKNLCDANNHSTESGIKEDLKKTVRSLFLIDEDLDTPRDMPNLCDANNHSTESSIKEDLKKTVRSLFLIDEDLDTPRDMTNLCDANNHSTESGIKEDLKKTVRSLFLIDEDLDTPRDMTNLCDANNHSTESGIKEDLKKTVRSLFLIDEDLDTARDMTNLCDANNHSTESGIKEDLKKTVRSLFLIDEDLDTPRDMTNLCDANNHSTESGIKEDLKKTVRSLFLIDAASTPTESSKFDDLSSTCSIQEKLKEKKCSACFIDTENTEPTAKEVISSNACDEANSSSATENPIMESLNSVNRVKSAEYEYSSTSHEEDNETLCESSCYAVVNDFRDHARSMPCINTSDSDYLTKNSSNNIDTSNQMSSLNINNLKQNVRAMFLIDTTDSDHLTKNSSQFTNNFNQIGSTSEEDLKKSDTSMFHIHAADQSENRSNEVSEFTDTSQHVCDTSRDDLKQKVRPLFVLDPADSMTTLNERLKPSYTHGDANKSWTLKDSAPKVGVSNETDGSLSTFTGEDNSDIFNISLSTVQSLRDNGRSIELNTSEDTCNNRSADVSRSDSSQNSQPKSIDETGVIDDIKSRVGAMLLISHHSEQNSLESSIANSLDTCLESGKAITGPVAWNRVKVTTMFSENKESTPTSFCTSASQDSQELKYGSLDDDVKRFRNGGLHNIRTQMYNKGKKSISNVAEDSASPNSRVLRCRNSLLRLHEQVNVSSPTGSDNDPDLITALTNQGDYDMRKRDLALGRISSDNDDGEFGLSKDVYKYIPPSQGNSACADSCPADFGNEDTLNVSSSKTEKLLHHRVGSSASNEDYALMARIEQPIEDNYYKECSVKECEFKAVPKASVADGTPFWSSINDSQLQTEDKSVCSSDPHGNTTNVKKFSTSPSSSSSLKPRRKGRSNFLSPDRPLPPPTWQCNNMLQPDQHFKQQDDSHPELAYLDIVPILSRQQEVVKTIPVKQHDVEFIISPPESTPKSSKQKSVKFNTNTNTD